MELVSCRLRCGCGIQQPQALAGHLVEQARVSGFGGGSGERNKTYHHVGNYLLNGALPPNHGQI